MATKQCLSVGGWTIQTRRGHIAGEQALEGVSSSLGNVVNLPEQLYLDSFVDFKHIATGVSIRLDATGALNGWREENLPPVRVAGAGKWLKSREREVAASQATYLDYDWTFTTPYSGSLHQPQFRTAIKGEGEHQMDVGHDADLQWVDTDDKIDRQLLMTRDPILLYDEVMLYESELDDSGVSNYSIKVRVMARCWFALARFYLRVDGTIIRLREVRLFCKFDKPNQVLKEITHSEGTMEELVASGAPTSSTAFLDADCASTVLKAVAPVAVKLFRTEKLSI